MPFQKFIDVDHDLIAKASCSLPTVEAPTTRETFTHSVETWLPIVVAMLKAAGLIHGAAGKRRPRKFDPETWDQLDRAESEVAAARVALLRACLTLQAEHGDETKDFIGGLPKLIRKLKKEAETQLAPEE